MSSSINSESCRYCYLDIDVDNHRSKLALAAAFVDATDSRYGFSSKDLRKLGGSELSRVEDLISTDHEWIPKVGETGGIQIRAPHSGNRIVLRLYWDVAPLACENFATLCANGGCDLGSRGNKKKAKPAPVGECGKPLSYRNSIVHRIVPGFIVQGGDFVFGNGSGGESIYGGKKFKDERGGLALKHSKKGVLSMGNSGKNSNTSQFFLTFKETPQCDGKHVIFGEVLSGLEVLEAVEKVGTAGGAPSVPVTITDCGIYLPFATPAAGYWYDKPDSESYDGVTPVFVVRPRVAVLAPSRFVLERFAAAIGTFAVLTLISAEDEDGATDRVIALLESFAVDAVVVAPACSGLVASLELPSSWASFELSATAAVSLDDVVIVSKPATALSDIRSKSWACKREDWHLIE